MKLKQLETLCNKYPTSSFIIILFASLFVSRWAGLSVNIHPSLDSFRLHHFYYGLFLLSLSAILSIFTKLSKPLISILTAISLGMIIDELVLVFTLDKSPYTWQSFPEALIITFIFSVILLVISCPSMISSQRKKKLK